MTIKQLPHKHLTLSLTSWYRFSIPEMTAGKSTFGGFWMVSQLKESPRQGVRPCDGFK